jgi:hypothetical protein
MADPWTLLAAGDILGGVLAPFTNILGGWFFAGLLLAMVGFTWLKTQDSTMASIVAVTGGIGMWALLPTQAEGAIYIMVIVLVAASLQKVLTRN